MAKCPFKSISMFHLMPVYVKVEITEPSKFIISLEKSVVSFKHMKHFTGNVDSHKMKSLIWICVTQRSHCPYVLDTTIKT